MSKLERVWGNISRFIAISLCCFHIYTGIFGCFPNFEQKAIHIGLALSLVFLLYPLRKKATTVKKSPSVIDLLIIAVLLFSCIFIFANYLEFTPFMVRPINNFEIVLCILTALIMLEATRRTIGWALSIVAATAFLYALLGQYIPGYWAHPGFALSNICTHLYLSADGMWGFMTGLSATYIAMFIIFGSLLLASGAGETLVEIAKYLTGRFRGGPAKVAILSSGFFAMISGSPTANVATTGAFTIPMMKKLGYKPEFAAGVEAAASSAGVLTPPIMGAAGFIIAEILGVTYLKVVIAAAIPAYLFYVAAFMGVHFQAVRLDLKPLPKEEIPAASSILIPSKMTTLVIPIGILLYMLIKGYSLMLVGTSACVAVLITYVISGFSIEAIKRRIIRVPSMLEKAGRTLVIIPAILVTAQMLLFFLEYTGLNLKFSIFVMSMGTELLLNKLILLGILVMVLGTGLPVSAAYLLGYSVAGTALVELGLLPMSIHLFILYYAVMANLTPPLCPAVYVASTIAGSNWLKSAGVALKLSPLLYLMPFIFVFDPTFIMIGAPAHILINVLTATIGAVLMSSGLIGQLVIRCNFLERIASTSSGVLLLLPGYKTDFLGVILICLILIEQMVRSGKRPNIRFRRKK